MRGRSKAVWIFSENSSDLVVPSFRYNLTGTSHPPFSEIFSIICRSTNHFIILMPSLYMTDISLMSLLILPALLGRAKCFTTKWKATTTGNFSLSSSFHLIIDKDHKQFLSIFCQNEIFFHHWTSSKVNWMKSLHPWEKIWKNSARYTEPIIGNMCHIE